MVTVLLLLLLLPFQLVCCARLDALAASLLVRLALLVLAVLLLPKRSATSGNNPTDSSTSTASVAVTAGSLLPAGCQQQLVCQSEPRCRRTVLLADTTHLQQLLKVENMQAFCQKYVKRPGQGFGVNRPACPWTSLPASGTTSCISCVLPTFKCA
jgi:hypothetical protein